MGNLPYQVVAELHTDGRITIPKWLRDDFDIEEGDRLVMMLQEVEKQ